jgi:hypothetical protein
LVETTPNPFNYKVRVYETPAVHSPDSPNPMTVVGHFRPGTPGSTATVLPMGIFGTFTDIECSETYDFGSAADPNTGIIAADNVDVTSNSQAVFVTGWAHLGGTLTVNANGSLTQR